MNLIKQNWTQEDGQEFVKYLESLGNPSKVAWAKNILKTNLNLLVVPTKEINRISKEIAMGNFYSFLDLQLFVNYETIALFGILTCKIKNFDVMERYLKVYLDIMENWAHCDLLTLDINESNIEKYKALSQCHYNDEKVFKRRFSLLIYLIILKDLDCVEEIFCVLKKFENEKEYYVIMMAGWLLSECIIKHREKTLSYLKNVNLNKKIVNKAIQKCRESLRQTKEEKDELLTFKIK